MPEPIVTEDTVLENQEVVFDLRDSIRCASEISPANPRTPTTSCPAFFVETPGKECVICYESLNIAKNFCVTECGHEFCLSCMMKHMQRNNGCPMCREELIEDAECADSDDEDEDLTIEGSDNSTIESDSVDDIEDGEDLENEYAIEELEAAFMAKGYGLKDALSLLMYKFSKTDAKYSKSYIRQLEADIDDMNEELQRECEERVDMGAEDTQAERDFQTMLATLD